MTTEAIRQKESGNARSFSQDRMVIGSHLVQAGPCAFGIDGEILEDGYAVGGACKHLLYKCRFEVCLVARRLFRIVPRQQKSQSFRAKVEAVRHVDNHGCGVRKLVEWFGWDEHA